MKKMILAAVFAALSIPVIAAPRSSARVYSGQGFCTCTCARPGRQVRSSDQVSDPDQGCAQCNQARPYSHASIEGCDTSCRNHNCHDCGAGCHFRQRQR